MCIGPVCDFFVGRCKLKNVERFKYLGSYVNQACNLKAEITARIQAVSSSYYNLKEQVFDSHDLTTTPRSVFTNNASYLFSYMVAKHGLYTHTKLNSCALFNKGI